MHLPFFDLKRKFNIKPVVLLILDGYGEAPASSGNAITLARKPNLDRLINSYPHGILIASGESVGLPANEVGNTEVGHLTLGAGRVILQDLKKINLAIEKGTFYDNRAFLMAANHVKKNSSKLHLVGLVSSGKVHSSLEHLYALLQFCKKEDVKEVYLHIFTDGRDAPPNEGLEIVGQIENHINSVVKVGKIATVSGRYYAMDRDRRWDRTQKAYNVMVNGQGVEAENSQEAIKNAYAKGQTDEFIDPTMVKTNQGASVSIGDNDSVIFFNYRIDRPRQLAMAFTISNFEKLKTFDFERDPDTNIGQGEVGVGATFNRGKVPKNLFFVTMTEYHKKIPVSMIAFVPEMVIDSLSQVLARFGLKQMRMSESEKERFVTYYFRGMYEEPFEGEDKLIVPSLKIPTYDRKPEMSLQTLVNKFKDQMRRDIYHFAVINFASPDMVAHTGNLYATIAAIEIVDKYVGELVRTVLSQDGTVIITADHGNAEELLTFPNTTYFYTTTKGTVNTEHSNNPVPVIFCNGRFSGKPVTLESGSLADIAPTILRLIGIAVPDKMTGSDLLKNLKVSQ